ncbi:MAG TPA: L-lactate permease [Terriglobales bacterium]|nr:L-lactate permease [Terriglobales bacterium]
MPWTQVYDPLNHWWLSTLIAALPIIVLFTLLAGLRVKPHLCALAGAGTALIMAIWVFHMPAKLAGMSFFYGVAFGLLKIAWIVVAAVYLYDISVETGKFEIMKHSVAGITADRRLQLLLVAFCFGAFIEGAAGFGAPVAIAGAFMIGLGFKPFHAAALNLIANTAPVAWGAIGTPVHTLALVSALPESDLNAMIGRILPFTAVIVPFWLVRAMVGWKETFEVLPAILVVGISFAATQYLWSNHVDSNLVDIASGVVSLVVTLIFLRFWQPKHIWRFEDERDAPGIAAGAATTPDPKRHYPGPTHPAAKPGVLEDYVGEQWQKKDISYAAETAAVHYTGRQVALAWMPFAILSVFVLLWGLPSVKGPMNKLTTPVWNVPYLHNAVTRAAPVVRKPTPEAAKYDFNWLSATGTGCFLAAVVAGVLLGLGPGQLLKTFFHTLYRMRLAVVAISAMLGLGFITRYSGMDGVLGLAFTRTGWLFPFFGTFLGWLGVALTGSDTSSNALFGSLQHITAQQLNLDPILMCAANSAGGVMGKMVDAQSIVVATSATNQVGNEGIIFRFVVWHSIALAAIVGLIVMMYAYVAPNLVPHGLTIVK